MLAKPIRGEQGTYDYHIKEVYAICREILIENKEVLLKVCDFLGVDWSEFELAAYKVVVFHDFGKVIQPFQLQMKRLIDGLPKNKALFFRHEVASALLFWAIEANELKQNNNRIPYEILAVLSHHKPLQVDFHSFEREKNSNTLPSLSKMETDFLANNIRQYIAEINLDGFESYALKTFSNKQWVRIIFDMLYERFATTNLASFSSEQRRKDRLYYALLRGLLVKCDWLASAEKHRRIPLQHDMTSARLMDKIKQKIEQDGRVFEPRQFMIQVSQSTESVIAIGPTGSGKTEASLLWATNSKPCNILFLLPTMVTSNSIYERIVKYYFQEKECGLTHSSVEAYYLEKLDAEKNEDVSYSDTEIKWELNKYRAFMAPVMLSTVDQILSSGFNIGYWCQKEWALVGSRVIFDEIHGYQHYTLGLITRTIEKVLALGGQVCLMSATMPTFLQQHFLKVLKLDEPIIAKELMEREKCDWIYVDHPVEELYSEILSSLKQGKKIAIVVNTVNRAQTLFKQWTEIYEETGRDVERILCYHSRFTMLDRKAKEDNLLDKNKNYYDLVIATQAIEVSLDIDFDEMYSECAPLDSLIQRAGRCNRYAAEGNYRFIVFPYSEVAEKFVYKSAVDILEKTNKIISQNPGKLSESKLKQMLDEVYSGVALDEKNLDFQEGYCLYDNIAINYKGQGFIFDLPVSEEKVTRKINYANVSIIPICFYDEVKTHWERKEYQKIKLYEVPVPISLFKKVKRINNPMNLPIYSIDYSKELGIQSPGTEIEQNII